MRALFASLDDGRCLVPRHALISDPEPEYRNRAVLAATQDGRKYVAFLPHGGAVQLDLTSVPVPLAGKWYNALTGQYGPAFSVVTGGVQTLVSRFGGTMSLLVLETAR